LLPGSGYVPVWLPDARPTQVQIETLWSNFKRSIDAGRGVLLNFESPPWNRPRASYKSDIQPQWRGNSTIYHYVAGLGYAVDTSGRRHFWIADPGFPPFGFWCSLEQVAGLIVPPAYAFASTAPILADKLDDPSPTPPPAIQPEIAALTAQVDKLTAALSTLLSILETRDPDLLRAYLDATKG
jgi:putative chitinase